MPLKGFSHKMWGFGFGNDPFGSLTVLFLLVLKTTGRRPGMIESQ